MVMDYAHIELLFHRKNQLLEEKNQRSDLTPMSGNAHPNARVRPVVHRDNQCECMPGQFDCVLCGRAAFP